MMVSVLDKFCGGGFLDGAMDTHFRERSGYIEAD